MLAITADGAASHLRSSAEAVAAGLASLPSESSLIMLRTIRALLKAIRFEQTAFALPFALTSTFVAAGGWPRGWDLAWILVAMVGARTAGMAFNRLVDVDYDRENPRTAGRALVTGE